MKRATPNRSMLSNEKPIDIQPTTEIPKLPKFSIDSSNYCVINSNDVLLQKQKEIQDLLHEYSQLQQRIKKINQRLDELRR